MSEQEIAELKRAHKQDKLYKKISEHRLDPTNPKNIIGWLILRTRMLENDEIEQDIKRAINLMNMSFIVVSSSMGS